MSGNLRLTMGGLAALALVAGASVPVPAAGHTHATESRPRPATIPDYLGTYDGFDQEVLFSRQDRLAPRQRAIEAEVKQLPGYVDIVMDLAGDRLVVLWSQGASSDVGLARARQTLRRSGVTYEVVRRQHSRLELQTGLRRIMTALDEGKVAGVSDAVVTVEGMSLEHDGIEVRISPDDPSGRTPLATESDALEKSLTVIAGSQVTVKAEPFPMQPGHVDRTTVRGAPQRYRMTTAGSIWGSRQSPVATAPGGVLMVASSGICSSGFSFTYGAHPRTTSARHCTGAPYKANSNGSSFGGNVPFASGGRYGMGRMFERHGAAHIFVGSPHSIETRRVDGTLVVGRGGTVCTEGGNSGEHCGLTVVAESEMWSDGWGSVGIVKASRNTSTSTPYAVIQGDSGGPVAVPRRNGTAGAVGLIQRYYEPSRTDCPGAIYAGSNACSDSVGYTTVKQVGDDFGQSVATG